MTMNSIDVSGDGVVCARRAIPVSGYGQRIVWGMAREHGAGCSIGAREAGGRLRRRSARYSSSPHGDAGAGPARRGGSSGPGRSW